MGINLLVGVLHRSIHHEIKRLFERGPLWVSAFLCGVKAKASSNVISPTLVKGNRG